MPVEEEDLDPKDIFSRTEPESSASTDVSSRPGFIFDVFLSFRRDDTRKNFTAHLYTALVQAGIHTFLDDNEIRIGEDISSHLFEAIRRSRICIAVFSKGYASSRWCLDELAEIIDCKHATTHQIVLPIFYDIDPLDVRKQTGTFAEAFEIHEERYKEEMEKVKRWREALEEVGNQSGWYINESSIGHETEFIQDIVKHVSNKLDRKPLHVAKFPVGIEPRVDNVIDLPSIGSNDVLNKSATTEWTLLITNLLLEGISAIFDQLGYALLGMVLAFIALILSTIDIVRMARNERITWDWRSLLPRFHRRSAHVTPAGKPFGTLVEYFGFVGAVWQCFYSAMEYAYARQNKDNPIKMCLLPFIFVVCAVISKLTSQKVRMEA